MQHEDFDPSVLVAHEVNGVKELDLLRPVSSFSDTEGRTIYDFGQNAAAYVALTVAGEAGATVLIDPVSLPFLAGSQIDFVDELIGASFKITNPNATASCGCGTSFSV